MKTSVADLLVQVAIEGRSSDEIDWKRNVVFTAFGLAVLGAYQYFLYVNVFARLFPGAGAFAAKSIKDKLADVKGMMAMFGQVGIDQFLHMPFTYFPIFYLLKQAILVGEGNDFATNAGIAFQTWKNNILTDMMAAWKFWLPANIVNFGFMPMHLRVVFMAALSLFWTAILSVMRGGADKSETAETLQKLLPDMPVAELEALMEQFKMMAGDDNELSNDELVAAMKKLGVTDEAVVKAFFLDFDKDGSGSVTFDEFVSAIYLLGAGDEAERISAIFRVCDSNKNGEISADEMLPIVHSLISAREKLVVFHDENETMNLIGGMAGKAFEVHGVAERRQKRVAQLKRRDASLKGETLDQVVGELSKQLVDKTFKIADTDNDSVLTVKEFEAFVQSPADVSAEFLRLFDFLGKR